MAKPTFLLVMLLTCLTQANAAIAFDLNFGVKASADVSVTAGLDDKTVAFINGLPEKVKIETLSLLKQALPLIDSSVEDYIKQVNRVLDNEITNLECALIGTGEALGADLKHSLPFSGPPEPVESLQKDSDTVINSFSVTDGPISYAQKYADLLYRAEITACQVSISPQASIAVNELIVKIRPRWNIWYRLYGTCTAAQDCYNKTLDTVKFIVSNYDPRDVAAVDAGARLDNVITPKFSTKPWEVWVPTETEQRLGELLSIQDGVNVARVARKALAAAYLKNADNIIASSEKIYASAARLAFSKNPSVLDQLASIADSAVVPIDQINKECVLAKELDKSSSTQGASIAGRAANLNSTATALSSAARQDANEIRKQMALDSINGVKGIRR